MCNAWHQSHPNIAPGARYSVRTRYPTLSRQDTPRTLRFMSRISFSSMSTVRPLVSLCRCRADRPPPPAARAEALPLRLPTLPLRPFEGGGALAATGMAGMLRMLSVSLAAPAAEGRQALQQAIGV